MSGSFVTMGGGVAGTSGVLSVPSNLPSAVNDLLQGYLNSLETVSGLGFQNYDAATGGFYTDSGTGAALLGIISNTDNTGSSAAGAGSYPNLSVPPYVTTLLVQAPGDLTVTGSSSTTVAEFGANSNVDYLVQNASSGSIFASGGSDTISLLPSINNVNESIYSSGQDSINLFAGGNDAVSVMSGANDTVNILDSNATVTATGNSTVGIWWDSRNSGGTLDFINNSSTAATVFSSVFANGQTAFNSITVQGGAGGGYFNGGQAGNNSLVGGTGAVTLVGAGNGDFLEAQSGAGQNDFFGGSGVEQMVATSSTGANLFALGLNYPGLGSPTVSGTVSTAGSGDQTFDLGNSNGETITGSTAATHNVFNVVSDATTGGSNFTIVNFGAETQSGAYSIIYLMNDSINGAGDATITGIMTDQFNTNNTDIGLSDGTRITLVGVAASSLHTGVDSSTGATFIWQH